MRRTPEGHAGNAGTVRVGYLLRMYPRFSQTFVVNEIRELERQGLDIAILSLKMPNDGVFHESVCRVRARAYYAPATHHGRLLRTVRGQLRLFRKSPTRYRRALKILRGDREAEWFDLGRAAHVLKWARENHVRHLHVHFGTGEATVALLAHVLGGPSYSLTLHAFDIYRNNVNRALLAEKINYSTFTVTVSQANRDFMVENLPGVDPRKIRVNYNGVDLDRFRPVDRSWGEQSIFGLGRLKEKKGFIHLVRAVRRLRDEGFPVKCRIGGDGEEEANLRKAIAKWELGDLVTLLGPIGEDEVCGQLQRAGCFVLPCIEAKDGNIDALPTVLLESLAAGCPAVSTELSGIPEIIEHEVSGLLVAPQDDKALARAIRSLLIDARLSRALAEAGRQRAEERFDIRRNVARLRAWLQEAATGSALSPVPVAVSEAVNPVASQTAEINA